MDVSFLEIPHCDHSNKRYCLGNYRGGGTPVPISNTEVKLSFAYDTAVISRGKVGRCQDSAFYVSVKLKENVFCFDLKEEKQFRNVVTWLHP